MAVWWVLIVACGRREAAPPAGAPVRVDGSSTVYLISKIVGEEAGKQGLATADVRASGTTAGFQRLCKGEIDIADASRPIQQVELDACRAAGIDFIELPIGYDGLAVVVNARNTWVDHLTVRELKAMWSPDATGQVTTWSQVRAGFPDQPLHLFGPGHDSGTFDYFTQAIVGTQRASRTDYTASEDDTVLVRGVVHDDHALAYFGYAYLRDQPQLRAVPIDQEQGAGPIAPSPTTVANGAYQPLSRPIFIYVNAKSIARPEVDRWVAFYLGAVHELSAEVGYISLPVHINQLAQARYRARRTGTLFGGRPPSIGMTIDKLLEAEQR